MKHCMSLGPRMYLMVFDIQELPVLKFYYMYQFSSDTVQEHRFKQQFRD
jgi:hypothetical protein